MLAGGPRLSVAVMRNRILITSVLVALAAPAGVSAAPAKLSSADANASAQATAAQTARGLEMFGYHAVSAKLDRPERLGPRRFRAVVGLIATATRAGARDGSCLLTVHTWQTSGGLTVSRAGSLTCTRLF
jgi:hypothetical protein